MNFILFKSANCLHRINECNESISNDIIISFTTLEKFFKIVQDFSEFWTLVIILLMRSAIDHMMSLLDASNDNYHR